MNNTPTETKAKPTAGPWKVDESTEYTITIVSPWTSEHRPENNHTFGDYRGGHICSMNWNTGVPRHSTALANANLIAEAGTVYHETCLTPRELVERHDKRGIAIRMALAYLRDQNPGIENNYDEHSLYDILSKALATE